MLGNWGTGLLVGLETINQILGAGIAITAFSLLLYALTFNLRDRVARSFAVILTCVVIVFTGDAISSAATDPKVVEFLLRLEWVGILFLPPAYLQFSDALLATTGKPSRGRRRWLNRFTYLLSALILLTAPITHLFGPVSWENSPAAYLTRTWMTEIFTLYYIVALVLSWYNLIRAYRRTTTNTSRRRMAYLLIGATGPALGSYPYLMFGSGIAHNFPTLFWLLASLSNLLVGGLVVIMAYAVAFFGVPWPDRVVKTRLFKWIMRGPVTAGIVLGLTTLVRRAGLVVGQEYSAVVPIVMVGSILLLEYLVTLFFPLIERWFFFGRDRADLMLVRNLQDRLLTQNDLLQFVEMVLSAACDRLQSSRAFVAGIQGGQLEMVVQLGHNPILEVGLDSQSLLTEAAQQNTTGENLFVWDGYYLIPLHNPDDLSRKDLVGLLGISKSEDQELDAEELAALVLLGRRVSVALRDRQRQQEAFNSLQALTPDMELIQRIRAAARYDGSKVLSEEGQNTNPELAQWVKEALTHYWGGPKLTQSPLMKLRVVQAAVEGHDGNQANALRYILRRAIEQVKPEGERRFTGEWILYNILEMKFMEGRKVREIAMRLAMSEADLYRKQRIAIEAVANAISEMEDEAQRV